MYPIGIESSILKEILNKKKTIEVRLGKPKFLKLRVGDEVSIREDIWKNGAFIKSIKSDALIKITQLLYFETFEEMFAAIDFRLVIPSVELKSEAISKIRQFYTEEDETEFGVIAIYFVLK